MQSASRIAVAGATGRVGRHAADVLAERGHQIVAISRSQGVDVITGEGLAKALAGVSCIIDAATGPSPEEQAATTFFTTAARNLQTLGHEAGVQRVVTVSIIGADKFTGGYGAAKIAHERAALAGPIPGHILRAAQFHEFVAQLVAWGTQGDVASVQPMRTQLVAARAVAEVLADLATGPAVAGPGFTEVAGPREESMLEMASLLVTRQGLPLQIQGGGDPTDPDRDLYLDGSLLPGPDAILAGPTFAEWLESTS